MPLQYELRRRQERGRVLRPRRFGIGHPKAKLDEGKVLLILGRGDSNKSFARRFGVCPRTIRDVLHGRSWKHVAPHVPRLGRPVA